MRANKDELIVVTGASSGMGETTAYSLAAMGYHVLGGVLSADEADKISRPNIEPILLDITNGENIDSLVRRITNDRDKRPLRALINNAGIEFNAPFELLGIDEWRRQFEVNLFGQVSITQRMLPLLRASKGTIVNITSVGGRVALPNYSAYAATKFAFEAMSDSLRRAVKTQGIKVIVIEPGGIRTHMAAYSGQLSLNFAKKMSPKHQRLYRKLVDQAVASQTNFLRHAMSADAAGEKIAKITVKKSPRTRYWLGADAHMTIPMASLLPPKAMDWVLALSRRFS